jgi:hypothetical protein
MEKIDNIIFNGIDVKLLPKMLASLYLWEKQTYPFLLLL